MRFAISQRDPVGPDSAGCALNIAILPHKLFIKDEKAALNVPF
jgi:hypothetical protein